MVTSGPAAFKVGSDVCTAIQDPGENPIYKPEDGKTYQDPAADVENLADEDATIKKQDRKLNQAVGGNPENDYCSCHLEQRVSQLYFRENYLRECRGESASCVRTRARMRCCSVTVLGSSAVCSPKASLKTPK